MNARNRILSIIILLALLALACSTGSPAVNPNAASGSVMFQDDFSGKGGKWDSHTEAGKGTTDYANSAYRIFVDKDKYYLWANPGDLKFNDVRVEVDATKTAGPDQNDMGVICRYVDASNFYFLTVSSDGYYGVMKYKDGSEDFIGMDKYGFDDTKIKPGTAINHIRADCVGSTLTLYANGEKLVEVTDSDFTSGNVGLLAGTYDTPGVDVSFDNFKVTKP